MRRRMLGDLEVSELALGTSTWGTTTEIDDAGDQLKRFVAAGGTLVDTADVYGGGRSEELIGELLGTVVARSDIVLASKAGVVPGGRPPLRKACDAKHLLSSLDESLRRLRTDHLDLWQLHGWDPVVPIAETLGALDIAVRTGRVRYVGVSNYSGWQTAKAALVQHASGFAPLVSTQVEYSLLQRGIEREVVAAAADAGLGLLAWAALGRGVLTGKYRGGVPDVLWQRKFFQWYVAGYVDDRCNRVVEEVAAVADELGVTPLAVALAWVRDRPGVASAVIGARSAEQLRASIGADTVGLRLPAEAAERLDEVSQPDIGYPETGI